MTKENLAVWARIALVVVLLAGAVVVYQRYQYIQQNLKWFDVSRATFAQSLLDSFSGPIGLGIASVVVVSRSKNAAAKAATALPVAWLAIALAAVYDVLVISGANTAASPHANPNAASLIAQYGSFPGFVSAALTGLLAFLAGKGEGQSTASSADHL